MPMDRLTPKALRRWLRADGKGGDTTSEIPVPFAFRRKPTLLLEVLFTSVVPQSGLIITICSHSVACRK